jgi:hypothetical protein
LNLGISLEFPHYLSLELEIEAENKF